MQAIRSFGRVSFIFGLMGIVASAFCASPPSAPNTPARHLILMIGDGMGAWHLDAVRKYTGKPLAIDALPNVGAVTTFSLENTGDGKGEPWTKPSVAGEYDAAKGGRTPTEKAPVSDYVRKGATDSAAAGSAMASGRKTVSRALNVVARPDGYPADHPFTVKFHPTIIDYAESAGYATGLVSSVPFSHATPAAFVAKTHSRKDYGEIARQMLYSNVDVIMSATHPYFDDNGTEREPDFTYWQTASSPFLSRRDGKRFFEEVRSGFRGRTYLESKEEFDDLGNGDGRFRGGAMPNRVFGLARTASTLQQKRNRDDGDPADDWDAYGNAFNKGVPDLTTMTSGALHVLEQNPNGFFLMVEGGAIDWASHESQMGRMIEETIDFDRAVGAVIAWIENPGNGSNWSNTLLIVTADHECGQLQPVGDASGKDVILRSNFHIDLEKKMREDTAWKPGTTLRDHTNSLVPLYAGGPGSEQLKATESHPYIDITKIFAVLRDVIRPD